MSGLVLGVVITTLPGAVPRVTTTALEVVVPNEFVQATVMLLVLGAAARVTEPVAAAAAACVDDEPPLAFVIVQVVLAGTVAIPPTV